MIVLFSQKLAFSDDESTQEEEVRRDSRSQSHSSKEEKRSAERDRDSESSDRDERRVSYVMVCHTVLHVQRSKFLFPNLQVMPAVFELLVQNPVSG